MYKKICTRKWRGRFSCKTIHISTNRFILKQRKNLPLHRYIFFNNIIIRATPAMTSTTMSNDVDLIKSTINEYQKSIAIIAVVQQKTHFSFHTLTGRSSETLNLCMVLINHEPGHVKNRHRNIFLYLRGDYSRMRTIN